jgi:hypothetical protein
MGEWYITEGAKELESNEALPTSVVLQTTIVESGNQHTDTNLISSRITTIKQMDDTLILTKSLETSKRLSDMQEYFIFTYGVTTAVRPDKAAITIICRPPNESC